MTDAHSEHPELRNPVWASLMGPHRHVARVGDAGRAAAFGEGCGFFAGFDDPTDASAWDDAVELMSDGFGAFFHPDPITPPNGWTLLRHIPASQLAAPDDLAMPADARIVELGAQDHDDIHELVSLAEPGPFDARSAELGRFVGFRDGGRLLAMAGERLCSDSTVEISAVSVHPDARRRGLGSLVTTAIAVAARRRGQLPYLHVLGGNDDAERLYESMGFTLVRRMTVTVFERDAAAPSDT